MFYTLIDFIMPYVLMDKVLMDFLVLCFILVHFVFEFHTILCFI